MLCIIPEKNKIHEHVSLIITLKGGQEERESNRDFFGAAWGGLLSRELLGLFTSETPILLKADDDTFEIQDYEYC